MATISKELFQVASGLGQYDEWQSSNLDRLREAASEIGKAWSGSWLGYHSRVYYANFQVPPPGAAFSQEWGFQRAFSMGSRGDWMECRFDDVVELIENAAGNPDFDGLIADGEKAKELFDYSKSITLSLIHANLKLEDDKFLQKLVEKIESEKMLTQSDYIQFNRPSGQMMSRDMIAIEKGLVTPPHIAVLARSFALEQPFSTCARLKKNMLKLASHIQNIENRKTAEERIGTNVFVGHGRSPFWRELKDFVNDRLHLPWDEFNRVPIAGVTNIARLSQMLDQACIAFLVMTAEDEQADGNLHARMNVIHEVGLFQGRLGFDRAIVLLEEGCQEFTNIQGLGQIRFPKGNISAIFEDVRQVLEREGIVE
ncbi:MAG: nucleotide-binding protein [Cyanobium sp. 49614_E6]|nr:nucleotide-binding protein [Cyanobium sp. 49614_E6]